MDAAGTGPWLMGQTLEGLCPALGKIWLRMMMVMFYDWIDFFFIRQNIHYIYLH